MHIVICSPIATIKVQVDWYSVQHEKKNICANAIHESIDAFIPRKSMFNTSQLFVFLGPQISNVINKFRSCCVGRLFRFRHRRIDSRHRVGGTLLQKIF